MKNGEFEQYECEKLSDMVQRKDWVKLNKFVRALKQRGASQLQLAQLMRVMLVESHKQHK